MALIKIDIQWNLSTADIIRTLIVRYKEVSAT